MINEFLDEQPSDAHWEFQDWRLANPDGFYLTQKSKGTYRLHHAGCHHVGSPFWDGIAHGSLSSVTANQKICSSNPSELFNWIADRNLSNTICTHCIDGVNPRHLQASNSAEKRINGWIADLEEWKEQNPNMDWHPTTEDEPSEANNGWAPQEELPAETPLFEGARLVVQVNAFERNPIARQQCIAYHGCNCSVCGFNFNDAYGSSAEGYIHVHHLKPLASIGKEYAIDPINDLRPVCANCHAVIHLRQPPYEIDELKGIFQASVITSPGT